MKVGRFEKKTASLLSSNVVKLIAIERSECLQISDYSLLDVLFFKSDHPISLRSSEV